MEEAGLAPPTFESNRSHDSFVARLLLHHFLTPEDLAWLNELGIELSDAQKKALIFVRESGAIDNLVYRQINAVDTLAASTELRRLRDLDLLEMKGRSSATYYVPGPKLIFLMGSRVKERQTHNPLAETPNLNLETHKLLEETHKLTIETHKLSRIPTELNERLKGLGKRVGKDEREDLIVDLCSYGTWTAGELARLLKIKDPRYLQREYLKPLVKAQKLQYLHPDMPNHPEQAYQK